MMTKPEHKHDVATSPVQDDFAVKTIDADQVTTVNGPVIDVSISSSGSATSPSDLDASSDSDKSALDATCHSPELRAEEGMSDTTLKDCEVREEMLESIHGQKVVSPVEVEESAELKDAVAREVVADGDSELTSGEDATAIQGDKGHEEDEDTSPLSHAIAKDPDTIDRSLEPAIIGLPASPFVAPRSTREVIDPSRSTAADEDATASSGDKSVDEVIDRPHHTHSLPPHLRSDMQLPAVRQLGSSESQHSATPLARRYSDYPRAPRQQYPHNSYNNYRSDGGGREELARMNALLMKTRNELEVERRKNANLRKTVELEKETVLDTALSVLTTDLFKKQAMTLNHQAKVQAKERDIQYRQARIEQLEVYLSEGQKQVYRYNEGLDGGPTMAEVDREHNRIQAELNAQKAVEDIQAKVSYHQQILQQREAALRMREEQYKALIRARFEAEMVQKAMPDMEAKLDEVAHIEYNHGFGAGRAAGRAEAEEEARQKGFLEGYGACYRSQITISNFRQGLISRDSPELDFLFDPAHADNMFTMGARVSGAECRKEKALLPHMAQRKEVPADKEPSVQHRIEEPAMQRKPEESVRRLALAPRPTFASELRGAQTMHNGHFVLANGSGSSSPASTPKIGSNGGSGGGMTRRMDEENKGRSIIKYEEAEESDLIDLY